MTEHASIPIPVIVGPTAGGKTSLAVRVALRFSELLRGPGTAAEIVSADSVQIFRRMDIGSAKPDEVERAGVPHHLIDVAEPGDAYTVHDWLADAERVCGEIRARGAVPIVVGGTNLYIKAFLEGLFAGPEPDEAVRDELRALPQAQRRAELERVDPEAAERIHPNDERRTVRALEVYRQTGVPISEHQKQWDRGVRADARLFGLTWPTEPLNRRINARVRTMMGAGLLDEVVALRNELGPQAREALGYKQLLTHLDGACTLDEAVERIKVETRRFAKNQRTWLRRLAASPGSRWFKAEEFLVDEDGALRAAYGIVDACLDAWRRGSGA